MYIRYYVFVMMEFKVIFHGTSIKLLSLNAIGHKNFIEWKESCGR